MFKNMAIWLVIGIVLMTVFNQFSSRQTAQSTMDYSQFLDEVKLGHITKVLIQGRTLDATTTDGKKIVTYAPPDLWMVSDLLKYNVKVVAKPEEEQSFLTSIFVSHELEQTFAVADHVIILANGKIATEGTPEQVRQSTDPLVYQYVNALPDGPVQFHYPGLSVEEDFGPGLAPVASQPGAAP